MRGQVGIVRTGKLREFSKRQLRSYLRDNPPDDRDAVYEELKPFGFRFKDTWIVNPFWSDCGRFEIDPLAEYGMHFLASELASKLGYAAPTITVPVDFMKPDQRARYDRELLGRVLPTVTFVSSS